QSHIYSLLSSVQRLPKRRCVGPKHLTVVIRRTSERSTPGGCRVRSRCAVRSPANGWSDLGRTVGSVEDVAIRTLPRRLPDERAHERGNDISPCLTVGVHADRLGRNCEPAAARSLATSSFGGDSRRHQTENVGEPRVLSDSVLPLFHDRRGP